MVHPRVLAQSGFRMVFLSAALAAMACQSGTDGVTYRASIDTATDAGSTSKPLSMAVPRTDEQALSETPSDPVNVGPSDLSKLTIRREETFEHVDLIAPERHIDGLVALLGASVIGGSRVGFVRIRRTVRQRKEAPEKDAPAQ